MRTCWACSFSRCSNEFGHWPQRLPLQRLLGPTEEPLHLNAPLTISREDLFAGALACHALLTDTRRIPGKLRASFTDVGPGEWLVALAAGYYRSGWLYLLALVPFAWTLFDRDRRALYDVIAGTRLVRRAPDAGMKSVDV